MKVMLALSLVAFVGCGSFGQGFRDGMAGEAPAAIADAIDKKLGDNFSELSDTIRHIPKPEPPPDNTMGYGLGVLIATVIANALKGGVRSMAKKKGGEA